MLLLLACDSASVVLGTDDTAPTGDSTPDDTGTPPGDSETTDSPTVPDEALSGVSARLNETIGSVVYVSWTQGDGATGWVEYRVGEEEWRTTPQHLRERGPAEQIVLGVPFGATLTYRVVLDDGTASPDGTIDTDAVPESLPVPSSVSGDGWDPDVQWVFTSLNEDGGGFDAPWWDIIVDRQGRVVWGWKTPREFVSMYPRVAADGRTLLLENNSYWGDWDGGAASEIQQVDIEGNVLQVWPTPGLHHSYTQLPDGSLAYGAFESRDETLRVISPDGTDDALWSCGDFLDSIGQRGSCGSNTVYYHEPSGHFLFSFYSLDSVIEIDAQTGETVRSFGNVTGAYTFDPTDSQFWWQHGPNFTEDGTLLISTHMSSRDSVIVAREFAIDDATQTLREVWSFGTAEEDQIEGGDMGEAWRLPGGNTLHNYGEVARLREATPEGDVVWDVRWAQAQYIGHSTPIEDLYAFE